MEQPKIDEQLSQENAVLLQENKSLKTDIADKINTISDLNKQIDNLNKSFDELSVANDALVAEFDNLDAAKKTVVKKSAPSKEYKTLFFEFEGRKKGFHYPSITFKGEKITAQQIAADAALQKQFIERNSGMIKHF